MNVSSSTVLMMISCRSGFFWMSSCFSAAAACGRIAVEILGRPDRGDGGARRLEVRFGDVLLGARRPARRRRGSRMPLRPKRCGERGWTNSWWWKLLVFSGAAQAQLSMPSGPARIAADAMPRKQAMLHHPRNCVERARQGSWIGNAAKRCIDDQMAAICDERRAVAHPQHRAGRQGRARRRTADRQLGGLEAEAVDLDRQRESGRASPPAWSGRQ